MALQNFSTPILTFFRTKSDSNSTALATIFLEKDRQVNFKKSFKMTFSINNGRQKSHFSKILF